MDYIFDGQREYYPKIYGVTNKYYFTGWTGKTYIGL